MDLEKIKKIFCLTVLTFIECILYYSIFTITSINIVYKIIIIMIIFITNLSACLYVTFRDKT